MAALRSAVQAPLPQGAHPALRRVWFWRGILLGLVLLPTLGWPIVLPLGFGLVGLGFEQTLGFTLPWVVLVVAYVVTLIVWTRVAFRRYSFEITDHAVMVKRGVWVRVTTLVPLRRVQEVVVRQGPLLRRHGLGSIRLLTDSANTPTPALGDAQLAGVREPHALAALLLDRIQRQRAAPPPVV